jgi:hypothetical protein
MVTMPQTCVDETPCTIQTLQILHLESHFTYPSPMCQPTQAIQTVHLHYTNLFVLPTHDLTGQVFKAESQYFDFGGSADIWKGHLVRKDTGHAVPVQIFQLFPWLFLKLRF